MWSVAVAVAAPVVGVAEVVRAPPSALPAARAATGGCSSSLPPPALGRSRKGCRRREVACSATDEASIPPPKVNVKLPGKSKFYRRCPQCKAAGVLMCERCSVLRCVSFPDESDGTLRS
eukprot:jgi/Chlat1/7726/Chrsp66S07321